MNSQLTYDMQLLHTMSPVMKMALYVLEWPASIHYQPHYVFQDCFSVRTILLEQEDDQSQWW